MKYLGKITDDKDLVTKEYVDNSIPDTSTFMVKGVDYVTAGKLASSTLGQNATAEGLNTTASGYASHAEGYSSTASGNSAHAEGRSTASGGSAHAEGQNSNASGEYAHAEGDNTVASGQASHAQGTHSVASGDNSHAEGLYTTAQRKSQHVFGEYNVLDTAGSTATRGTYVEVVGNGSSTTRSNARTLDWSGNEVLAGKLTVGVGPTNNMDVATKQYVDTTNVNTTYTFSGGINKFTVVPSDTGVVLDYTITPSIPNNVTGSGTSGYIAKFNGTNTITNGPAFGSATTTFLRNDGQWATPGGGTTSATATLTVAGWSNNTQTVTVTGVTSSNNVVISSAPASTNDYVSAGVLCTAQAANSLTFTCTTVPTNAITVNVLIFS